MPLGSGFALDDRARTAAPVAGARGRCADRLISYELIVGRLAWAWRSCGPADALRQHCCVDSWIRSRPPRRASGADRRPPSTRRAAGSTETPTHSRSALRPSGRSSGSDGRAPTGPAESPREAVLDLDSRAGAERVGRIARDEEARRLDGALHRQAAVNERRDDRVGGRRESTRCRRRRRRTAARARHPRSRNTSVGTFAVFERISGSRWP